MNERALSQELRRVADAVPVPDDLFPADLASRRPGRRTSKRWLSAAVAAAVLLAFLSTPLGARVVTAAGELFMQVTIKLVKVEKLDPDKLPFIDASSVMPGQTVVRETPGVAKQIAEGFHLSELEAGWPVPTYRAPGPDARVVRVSTFKQDELIATGVTISWYDLGSTLTYTISRRPEPIPPADARETHVTVYTDDTKLHTEQATVTLKGQPVTASKVGSRWSLYWMHETGAGSISGSVPLDELVKIAESMPDLK